jgi:DNA-directed RNA polymerase specialized sigma subunit
MNMTENYLKEYWFARRSIGRLLLDLGSAKAALEKSGAALSAAAKNEGGTEHAARIILSQHRAEVKSIEARLGEERALMARVEEAVKRANLSEREREYVRLRYFENRSALSVCQRLYVSPATGGRIRETALLKLAAKAG